MEITVINNYCIIPFDFHSFLSEREIHIYIVPKIRQCFCC